MHARGGGRGLLVPAWNLGPSFWVSSQAEDIQKEGFKFQVGKGEGGREREERKKENGDFRGGFGGKIRKKVIVKINM